MGKDYYAVLGVQKDADEAALKKVIRKLCYEEPVPGNLPQTCNTSDQQASSHASGLSSLCPSA